MHVDQIVKRVEQIIGQLESLRFTRKVLLAAKFQGHIEEAIEIGGLQWTETWKKRVEGAMQNVNIDEPKPKTVDESGLAGLGIVPVTNVGGATQMPGAPSSGSPKPPQI